MKWKEDDHSNEHSDDHDLNKILFNDNVKFDFNQVLPDVVCLANSILIMFYLIWSVWRTALL